VRSPAWALSTSFPPHGARSTPRTFSGRQGDDLPKLVHHVDGPCWGANADHIQPIIPRTPFSARPGARTTDGARTLTRTLWYARTGGDCAGSATGGAAMEESRAEGATPLASAVVFGTLVRQYRLARELTQAALAERAGLSVEAISVIERGKRSR